MLTKDFDTIWAYFLDSVVLSPPCCYLFSLIEQLQ